jgi:hypothetical protein
MRKSPLVIVGTGGSGTRAFARLAEAAGRAMGAHQNEANDAMAFFHLADKWCRRVYPAWRAGKSVDGAEFATDLRTCVEAHRDGAEPGEPWGWKQPRSLYMLPALASAFPDLLVLHVMRDGRDIAFGKQFRLAVAGDYAVPSAVDGEPPEVRLALMWAGPNGLAADFGENRLGERYLRLRLEDLCASPEETAARLVDFIDGDPIDPKGIRSIVETPPTLGRWRNADPQLLERVSDAASAGLSRFGYGPARPSHNGPIGEARRSWQR